MSKKSTVCLQIFKAIGNAIRDAQITFEKLQAQINEKDARVIELKHQVDQLLNLAIKNSISQGTTYKTKMAEFEKEIITLEEELDRLKAQRSVAQMDASSGEFIYRNIRMIMEQIDNVPVDVQKSLLRMLVHSIVVYDEAVEINMYIQPECMPSTLAQLPLKEENPALINDQNEVLASTPSVSPERQVWGLLLDKSRVTDVEQIQLVISFYRRRYGKLEFSLDQPFPQKPQKPPPINIIQQALIVKTFISAHPEETYLSAAAKLNLHRKRISKMLSMLDMLPPNFVEKAKDYTDPRILYNMNVKNINRILCHPCPKTIEEKLNALTSSPSNAQ